jgi:glycolate oxidase
MGLDVDAAALLLAAADTGSRAAADLDRIAELARAAGATDVWQATDATEAAELLLARRLAHPAMEKLAIDSYEHGGLIIDDVAVPRTRLAELLDDIEAIAAKHDVVVGVVGHAGDGNLHPNILVDRADPASVAAGQRVFDEIMERALALGGTCTGEHGVGLLKRGWLAAEIGPVGVDVQRAIKSALDPQGLLNPGKVLSA